MTDIRRGDGRKELGRMGERLAESFAVGLDYRIRARNWRCRTGEIDIVAMDGETLVFIEVRTRRMTGAFGTPQESVDRRKQRQVRETAQVYLHATGGHDLSVRFDLISVMLNRAGELDGIDHIKNAF